MAKPAPYITAPTVSFPTPATELGPRGDMGSCVYATPMTSGETESAAGTSEAAHSTPNTDQVRVPAGKGSSRKGLH